MNDKLDWTHKEAVREFNQNYRNYLESHLLFNILSESLSLLNTSADDQRLYSNQNSIVEDKLRENFLKTHLFVNSSENLMEEIRPEALTDEAKSFICDKVEARLELNLNQINEYLNYCKDSSQSSGSVKWSFNESDSNNESRLVSQLDTESEFYDTDVSTLEKLKSFNQYLTNLTAQIEKSKADLAIKSEHTFNVAVEVINLIKTILNEFKLEMYASRKNRAECEMTILKYDMLEAKVKSVYNDLLTDIYSAEKIKALGIIKSHVSMDTNKTEESLDQAQMKLEAYKSFGAEFDRILKTFCELRSDLETKSWTLNHLQASVDF